MTDDDDTSLFRSQFGDIQPLRFDRAEVGRPRQDKRQHALRREQASVAAPATGSDGLSDHGETTVGAEQMLLWATCGVQNSQLKRLRKGQLAIEASIDLHGLNIDQARQQLQTFLLAAYRQSLRTVQVVHGKANGSASGKPVIKNQVNIWLRQHPQVLGFSSCQPRHGGVGAVYVLLRRNPDQDRE